MKHYLVRSLCNEQKECVECNLLRKHFKQTIQSLRYVCTTSVIPIVCEGSTLGTIADHQVIHVLNVCFLGVVYICVCVYFIISAYVCMCMYLLHFLDVFTLLRSQATELNVVMLH